MINPGENKSIYFDNDRLLKLDRIAAMLQRQSGIRVSRSAVVMRAIDDLFLAVCPLEKTSDSRENVSEPVN